LAAGASLYTRKGLPAYGCSVAETMTNARSTNTGPTSPRYSCHSWAGSQVSANAEKFFCQHASTHYGVRIMKYENGRLLASLRYFLALGKFDCYIYHMWKKRQLLFRSCNNVGPVVMAVGTGFYILVCMIRVGYVGFRVVFLLGMVVLGLFGCIYRGGGWL
jgi:hypothetical protein